MPEVLEQPAINQSDSDALKGAFNTAMKEAGALPEAATETLKEGETPTLIPIKAKTAEAKEEVIVPKEFIEKPPEPKTEVVDEIPVNAGTKQLRDVLAKRDAKLKELAAERDELRKRIETAPAGPSKEQEEAIKAATERAAKLESELERAAYERSPKFARFGSEEKAELDSAKAYLEGTEIAPAILEAAAHASGQARLRILRDAGMDAETIAAIGPHLARADAVRRERDASLDNWKQGLAADQEAQAARQTQEEQRRQAQEAVLLKEVAEDMRKNNPAFQKVDGHDKWNALVAQNEKDAEEFAMGRKPLKELITLGYLGVAARTTQVMNTELKRQLNAANEELSKLKAAQPVTGKPADAKAALNGAPVSDVQHWKGAFNDALAAARPA